MIPIDGLLWFAGTLLPLAFLQRLLHREIQAIFLVLTRSPEFTIALFSLLFLPGVLLHELSHYLCAQILRVPAARFSLLPRTLPNGKLQLGYVETARTDILRDSMIGAAPLIAGGLMVAFIALKGLDLAPLLQDLQVGRLQAFGTGLALRQQAPDFPLWFYLLFAVSSTMLPSPSDRHAWTPLAAATALLLGLAALAGAGPWMLSNLGPLLNSFLGSTSLVFGLSAVLHAALLLPVGATRLALARVMRVKLD